MFHLYLTIFSRALFEEDLKAFISDVDETPIADNIQFLGANQPNTTGFPSRFILQSGTVITSDDMTKFLRELRSVAHSSPFQVIVFNPYFPWFDQLANVEMDTFKSSIFSLLTMAAVTYLLLFNVSVSSKVAALAGRSMDKNSDKFGGSLLFNLGKNYLNLTCQTDNLVDRKQ